MNDNESNKDIPEERPTDPHLYISEDRPTLPAPPMEMETLMYLSNMPGYEREE